jgi:GNAT superfamily N-acetyltransferase
MRASESFAIAALSAGDLEHNLALSHSVGWKDVAAEWRVLHEAATVLGVWHEGRLVAQGALGDYGALAWLAKLVVAPDFQRRGLGARLLDTLLARAASTGQRLLGLAATQAGEPLYASRQFAAVGKLSIMTGTPQLGASQQNDDVVALTEAEPALELDRRFTGCDRSRMLRARLRESTAARVCVRASAQGFALATAQGPATLVGPVLAETEASARALTAALLRAVPGPVRIDVPLEQLAFRRWLSELGLREQAIRAEMARGAARLPWQGPRRFALATQAWG